MLEGLKVNKKTKKNGVHPSINLTLNYLHNLVINLNKLQDVKGLNEASNGNSSSISSVGNE